MPNQYGSQSMVAPLRRVLMRRPDEAFAVDDPELWHYTSRPDLAIARRAEIHPPSRFSCAIPRAHCTSGSR